MDGYILGIITMLGVIILLIISAIFLIAIETMTFEAAPDDDTTTDLPRVDTNKIARINMSGRV